MTECLDEAALRDEQKAIADGVHRRILAWIRLVLAQDEPSVGTLGRVQRLLQMLPELNRLLTPLPADLLDPGALDLTAEERDQPAGLVETAQASMLRHIVPMIGKLLETYAAHVKLMSEGRASPQTVESYPAAVDATSAPVPAAE